MSLNTIIGNLQTAAEQTQYVSEQTHDVNVFVIGRGITSLNATTFQAANPFIAGKSIDAFDVETICDAQGWNALKGIITSDLSEPTAFKVGTIQKEIYVVGLYSGHIVGVRSFAVET